MTNKFLMVNKDLFKLGLNPIEILLMSQIMEYDRTTGKFFESDKRLAEDFGVSQSTVSRALTALEGKGLISRSTKNTKCGRERTIEINFDKIEELLQTSK